MDKPLYKPFKSKKAGKKFSVYVKSPSGGKRLILFGAAGMDDWRSGKATKEQRKSFRARMKGIKKKMELLLTEIKTLLLTGLLIISGD